MDFKYRKRLRLENYDYSKNGLYFITICSFKGEKIFGEIAAPSVDLSVGQEFYSCKLTDNVDFSVGQGFYPCHLTTIGNLIKTHIENLPIRFKHIVIDNYVVMPNHVHLIIQINNENETIENSVTIGNIIGALKSITTKEANKMDNTAGRKIWHFRFHDNIIRNQQAYDEIYKYIEENPMKWQFDKYYVE